MEPIEQLASERRIEQKIETSCMRLIEDLEVIRDESHASRLTMTTCEAVDLYLEYAETYIIKARILLKALRKQNTIKT